MKRRFFLVGTSTVLLAACAGPEYPVSDMGPLIDVSTRSLTGLNAQILAHTNAQRRAAGRASLKPSAALIRTAEQYVVKLARAGRISHSIDGTNVGTRAKAEGFRWRAIGENIAMGNGRGSDAEVAQGLLRQWMGSSGHRRNILASKYTSIGVAGVRHNGRAYGVQVFARAK